MKNGLFTLQWTDLWRGLVVSVLAAVAVYVLAVLNAPGFSFLTIDWAEIARIALASGIGYLVKNLLTTNDGTLLGVQG